MIKKNNFNLLRSIKAIVKAFLFYTYNHFITNLPSYKIRNFYLKNVLKVRIGKGTAIHMGCFFTGNKITIGDNTVINRKTYLDGRVGLNIGNSVSISPECYLLSLSHDINSVDFAAVGNVLTIGNYSWVGSRAILLPGINLANGTVVGAGSVVTKSIVNTGQVIGGVPAKVIGERKLLNYEYTHNYFPFFDTDITFNNL